MEDEIEEGCKLTGKQKKFCEEYIFDFNATRAAKVAGYSDETSRQIGSENLSKPDIQDYIKELQSDLSKTSGISRLKVLREHEKLAFSSIASMHNTWITRKEFENLTEDQKACISEIQTQTRMEKNPIEGGQPLEIDFVKIKLYDKQKSLDAINKMLGFDAATKLDLTSKGEKLEAQGPPVINYFNTAPPLANTELDVDSEKPNAANG